MDVLFKDRADAGAQLAAEVLGIGLTDPVVLALPRGGVPVAVPVARRLGADLDLIMVRKIGAPGHEEFAIGAVVDGSQPNVVWNDEATVLTRLSSAERKQLVSTKLADLEIRRATYFGDRAPVPVKGRDVVVVDDGIATGSTVKAALQALRRRSPRSVTLAVPVAPRDSLDTLRPLVDHLVCLSTPTPFFAVGAHYADFRQTTDDEVLRALAQTEQNNRKPR